MMTAKKRTLKSLCRGVRCSSEWGARLEHGKQGEWQKTSRGHWVTLKYMGRKYSFNFWQGVAITDDPSSERCLDSLLSDSQAGEMSLDEFAAEFWYNGAPVSDMIRTHKQCQETNVGIKMLLGADYEIFIHSER